MTHSNTVVDSTVQGNYRVVIVDVDVTSLGSAGAESFNPNDEVGDVDDYRACSVVSTEDATNIVRFDHLNDQIVAHDPSDDAGLDAGTDLGEVRLRIEGPR